MFRIGGLGLNFLITYIITHTYGDGVYGSYSLAFTIAQATGLLFALGFPNAIVSYLGLKSIRDPFSQHMLKKGLKLLIPFSLVPFAVYFFGAEFIASHLFNDPGFTNYIAIAAITVPAMVLHEFVLYFFIGTGNFVKFNIFMFVVPNVILLALLFFIKNVQGHHTFLFYGISVYSVLAIELLFALKRHPKADVETVSLKEMVRFSSPMMFSGIMIYLLNWTDVFMLGSMTSSEELGHYNLAYKVASLGMLVIMSMNVVLAPRIAALFSEGNLQELHKTVKKTTHLIIVLTVPLVLGLILFSEYILTFFGKDFSGGHQALVIISIGFMLNAATGNVDQILNMTGNQKLLQNLTIAGFIINVALNAALIPKYGINGSAVASLITNVLFNLVCVYYIKKKLGFYTFA